MSRELRGTFAAIADFQQSYHYLLDILEAEGTLVLQNRRIEQDPHIPPYLCYRRAQSVFVFPRQHSELSKDLSLKVFSGRPDRLWVDLRRYTYNPLIVDAKLTVFYQDADLTPRLIVTCPGEQLPSSVLNSLEEVFSH